MTRDQLLTYYRSLTPAARIELLVEQEKVKAQLESDQQALLAVLDDDPASEPVEPRAALDKGFIREEVACALRVAFETARGRLVHAQTLVERFPDTWALMAAGRIGYLHARNLLEATAGLDHDLAARVEAGVLGRAGEQTPAEFRRALKKAVAVLDPRGEADRHTEAAARRHVDRRDEADGMASVHAYLPAADAEIVWTCLDTLAGRTDPDDDRSMDQRRVDSLVELCADGLDRAGVTRHGRRPTIQVSVALSTLLGLDEQPGEMAGYGSIPAELAREIAFDTTGTWRRLVTDPCGRLVDLGTDTYRPPQQLQDFVIARDRACRMPGCNRKASSSELDHIRPWPGGRTEAANMHALCSRHHHLKHEAGWQVQREPDGTTTWTSSLGRRYQKPPATYPIDHTTTDPPGAAVA